MFSHISWGWKSSAEARYWSGVTFDLEVKQSSAKPFRRKIINSLHVTVFSPSCVFFKSLFLILWVPCSQWQNLQASTNYTEKMDGWSSTWTLKTNTQMYQDGSAAAQFYWLSTARLDGDPHTNAFVKSWAISIYLDGTNNTHYCSHTSKNTAYSFAVSCSRAIWIV